jgi:hypothetical protein
MKNASSPDWRKPTKFKGFRKDWRAGEPVIHKDRPLRTATAAFLAEGASGAVRVLGAKSRFAALSPEIKARAALWLRVSRGME